MNGDPWAVLGLEPGASQEDLRRAWRAAAARCHPDRGGDPEEFRLAKAAYEFLSQVALDSAQGRGGGSEGPPPRSAEPPPGPWQEGDPHSMGEEGTGYGPTIYASSRLTLGQWLCPFGVGSLVRRALGLPAWSLDRSASWAARNMAADGTPSSLRDVVQPLWLWVLLTPLVGLAWLVTALIASAFDSSGVAAVALAVALGAWWALVAVRTAALAGGAARSWWANTATLGPRGREVQRSAREHQRLQRQRARWGY